MRRSSAAALPILILTACATSRIASDSPDVSTCVPFLHAGGTRRDEVLDRLGEPAYRRDADGTMIWLAGVDQDGRFRAIDAADIPRGVPRPWSSVLYELALRFDAAGTYVGGSIARAQ